MILDIINWLVNIIDSIGYVGVFIAMFIESFFAPIPSELILPFAGFLSIQGEMNIVIVILVAGLASALGSLPFYLIGYWGNEIVLDRFLKRYGKYFFISNSDIEKGMEIFDKYGNIVVLLGRLIPIIRTVISFPAGLAKMNFLTFIAYTLVGSTAWSAVLALSGYFLGAKWEIVNVWIEQYQNIIIVVGVIAVLAFLLRKLYLSRVAPAKA